MARKYTLKRRADQQGETRRRIVEAAVELHSTVGPARTTISMIADRARVQRHTFYAHFPAEDDLYLACSGLALERDPLPDPEPWREIEDPLQRLRIGLKAVYDWYGRNAPLTGCVLRDAEYHAPTRAIMELRFGPVVAGWHEVLGEGIAADQRAMLALALSYFTWRTLVAEARLEPAAAVEAMVSTVSG